MMKNSEKPAFPQVAERHESDLGLTKREYFAAMAMQGIISGCVFNVHSDHEAQRACAKAKFIPDELLNQLDNEHL